MLKNTISRLDLEMKNSLQEGSADHERCMAAMTELGTLEISSTVLRKIPAVIATVKKVNFNI